jgi:hypothetical protein
MGANQLQVPDGSGVPHQRERERLAVEKAHGGEFVVVGVLLDRVCLQIILDMMNKNLKSSVYLFDGELKDGDESVESIGKKKIPRSNKTSGQEDHLKPLQVCILQPCVSAL